MLSAKDISIGFDGRNVLEGVSLEVRAGDRVSLIGPSGSGKTTLLRILVGLLRPDTGSVTLDDREIFYANSDWNNGTPRGESLWPDLTIVFQELNLFPNLSARENCLIGIARRRRPEAEQDLTDFAFALQVEDCLDRKPRQLSHGQRQRVAIIRSMVRRPRYLFLDEPTSSLDPDSRDRLANLLTDTNILRETAIVAATHDLHFSSQISDKFWAISLYNLIISKNYQDAVSIYRSY